ncbi:MAG TPA: hypothetical protein PKD55_01200 [Bellilinea sp.]|nr:hypothetical protein [Bellilinea sp.]
MKRIFPLVLALTLAACSTATPVPVTPSPTVTLAGALTPYLGPPPAAITTATPRGTATPLPTATPTPRTHIIKKGQDMFGLAIFYGVSVDQLMTANATINPNIMPVGGELKIPAPNLTPTPDSLHPPQPTPMELSLHPPTCLSDAENGLWCFSDAVNNLALPVEAVSGQFRILNRDTGEIRSQNAYSPLQVAGIGGSVPLTAYFPAPNPADGHFSAEVTLLSALPLAESQVRVLPAKSSDPAITITEDKRSAEVSGTVEPLTAEPAARRLTVVLTALDATGSICGIRVLSVDVTSQQPDYAYSGTVYSLRPAIAEVRVQVELLP